MDQWTRNVPLSPSKRPILVENEIEMVFQGDVSLYEGEKKTKYEKGNCTLTTHRIIWTDPYGKEALALPLSSISSAEEESGGVRGSPKISVILGNKALIRLGFKASGRDGFLAKLKTALKNRAWAQPAQTEKKKEEFTTARAGIGGIMKTMETRTKETDSALQQAFADLNALMGKAKDMVALSERLSLQLQKEQGENDEFKSMLISMGIASPVTKETAGSAYHTELARQLADWVVKPLEIYGGMIALTDLYCLFNRARGTSLISPDDLYRAAILFEKLNLPVRLRRFDSGVLVVQSLNFTDEGVAKYIGDIVRRDGPLTAFDLARSKNISLALANDQLTTAENMGVLCRDQTFEGIVFYLNFFKDPSLVKLYGK